LTLVSLLLAGCGTTGQDAGSDSSEALLGLLPQEATGVFFVDLQKATSIPSAQEAMAENREKLDEFISETGIDPTQDVFSLAGAITNQAKGEDADGVVVMKVRYDKSTLIGKIEEKNGELIEDDYQGVPVFGLPSASDKKDAHLAFLDDQTVVIGTPLEVRTVIDVHQKRAKSMLENSKLMKTSKSTNRNAIFWAAFVFSEKEMKDLTEDNPMLSKLSGIQSVVMSLDYSDRVLIGEIECQSESMEQNQQIADFLNGIKSFAAMGASEHPELAELLRAIDITSSPENIRVTAAIPEALLQKLETSEDS
jgi:hypothetical protein